MPLTTLKEIIKNEPVGDFVQFAPKVTVSDLAQHGYWNVSGQLFEVKPQAMY